MSRLPVAVLALMCAVCAFADGNTYYVDKNVETSGDGSSWENAYKKIQDAVDVAPEGSTIIVAPGEYGDDQGDVSVSSTSYGTQKCRVNITKRLTLKSQYGKETTHIVGRRGDGNGGAVDGNDPVMCVRVAGEAKGTVIEGFTIRDGEMANLSGLQSGPGGVGNPFTTSFAASSNNFYVAYCTISNCCAQRRSGMRGGTAIGTLFADNHAWGGTTVGESAGELYAYNCIFTQDVGTSVYQAFAIVNCTVCNNSSARGGISYNVYNTAQFDNGLAGDNGATNVFSSVYDGGGTGMKAGVSTNDTVFVAKTAAADNTLDHSRLCMAACAGDFRPVDGGYLYGLDGHYGKIEYTNLDFIPPDYKQRDFYGKKLADDAVIPIGVILPAATPATKPLRMESTTVSIGGFRPMLAGQYVQSEKAFDQIYIKPVLSDGKESCSIKVTTVSNNTTTTTHKYYPLRSGQYLYTFRSRDDVHETYNSLSHALSDGVYWVDRENGNDSSNDGLSSGSAFQSIQHTFDSLPASGNFVVKVAEGVYDNEFGSVSSWVSGAANARARGVLSRVGTFGLLLWATGSRDKTIIAGQLDTTVADDENGVGANALRCLVFKGDNCNVGVSGFTLCSGRPTGESDETDCRGGMGGAVVCSEKYGTILQDCTFTNNAAVHGSATQFCTCLRSLFKNNSTSKSAKNNSKNLVNYGRAISCIFEDNPGDTTLGSPGGSGSVFNCTVYLPGQVSSPGQVYTSNVQINDSIVWSPSKFVAPNAGNGGRLAGNIFWGCTASQVVAESGYVFANPKLANPSGGDYRPNWNSPAWTGGSTFDDTRAQLLVGDYNGDPVCITDDGKIVIGAVHSLGKERSGMYFFLR